MTLQWQTIPHGRGGDGAFADDSSGRWLIRRVGKRMGDFSLRWNGKIIGHYATVDEAKRRAEVHTLPSGQANAEPRSSGE